MRDTFYTAIDIGTSKVTVLVSRVGSEGDLKVFGTGVVPSEGIHRGRVENIEEVRESVRSAVNEAQRYMRVTDASGVYVSVSGSHITSVNRREVLDNQATPEGISPQDAGRYAPGLLPQGGDRAADPARYSDGIHGGRAFRGAEPVGPRRQGYRSGLPRGHG